MKLRKVHVRKKQRKQSEQAKRKARVAVVLAKRK